MFSKFVKKLQGKQVLIAYKIVANLAKFHISSVTMWPSLQSYDSLQLQCYRLPSHVRSIICIVNQILNESGWVLPV